MTQLRIPSLQHLSRNWHSEPIGVQKALVKLALNTPTFNYDPMFNIVRDYWIFKQPINEIEKGLRRGVKRESVLTNYLEILPLLESALAQFSPQYVQDVSPRYYPISQDLKIPFKPQFVYGCEGELYLPWFSFWKSNPLSDIQLALFASIVRDVIDQDPDLEGAKLRIFDFSVKNRKSGRQLNIIEEGCIEKISQIEIKNMLAVFSEGFRLANVFLNQNGKYKNQDNPDNADAEHPFLPGLFPSES